MADEKLAALLKSHIEQLTEIWMQSVRADVRISSDDLLSRSQLRDHVPAMIEDICDMLKSGETPDHTNTLEGRVKVYMRLLQGYRGSDLVREISLLRTLLLDFLFDNCDDPSINASLSSYYSAARIINLYMDETLRNAISAYSETVELPGMDKPQVN